MARRRRRSPRHGGTLFVEVVALLLWSPDHHVSGGGEGIYFGMSPATGIGAATEKNIDVEGGMWRWVGVRS